MTSLHILSCSSRVGTASGVGGDAVEDSRRLEGRLATLAWKVKAGGPDVVLPQFTIAGVTGEESGAGAGVTTLSTLQFFFEIPFLAYTSLGASFASRGGRRGGQ